MSEQEAIQHLDSIYTWIHVGIISLWVILIAGFVLSLVWLTRKYRKDTDIFIANAFLISFFIALTLFLFYHNDLKQWGLHLANQDTLEKVLASKERTSLPINALKQSNVGYHFKTKEGSYNVTSDFKIVHDIPQQFDYFYSFKEVSQDLSPQLKKGHYEPILHLHNLDKNKKSK